MRSEKPAVRILYVCRVFSGLETSLLSRKWQPTGAPTIYKVMERLARGPHDLRFVLTTKGVGHDYRTALTARSDEVATLDGFPCPVTVLAGERRFPAAFGRLRGSLTTMLQLVRLAVIARRFRPGLIYADRGNVLAASLFARLSGIPVVLRVMGIYPSMWQTLAGKTLQDRIYRWAYRAPYALALCTEDGTPGRAWLDRALAPTVKRQMLLNGVTATAVPSEPEPRLAGLPAGRVIILFVGRFEAIKGCDAFAEAILRLAATHRRRVHALMIGTGSRHAAVVDRVREAGASDLFTFVERLPHDRIVEAHARADIYVSLNRLGQLSNANLEAMLAGACLVMPAARPDEDVDVATEALVPADAAVRLPSDADEIAALSEVLRRLVDSPGERQRLSSRLAEAARTFVKTWDQRVDDELAMIGRSIGVPL